MFNHNVFNLCRGKGAIVNISSGIASIPFPLYSLYAASKVSPLLVFLNHVVEWFMISFYVFL